MHEARLYLVKEYRLRIAGVLSDNPVACVVVVDQFLRALRLDSLVGLWRDTFIYGLIWLRGRTRKPYDYGPAEYYPPFLPSETS